ncbi:hypothetical protein HXX76_005131 [Chlamydomonas incerta]|uniref:Non-specific serine/threonine protein kinase n=1 Tax=Chlamydomonas incerta TaxID=51695 RepID=A0A835W7M7_CHLIN|nr:hypothetical protein HXX76_005131 [Chlamydomonas incerta]|eukprot:KAG2438581.1 hypothetical protein HXX76_005131 [Chlamydomonas incerta]
MLPFPGASRGRSGLPRSQFGASPSGPVGAIAASSLKSFGFAHDFDQKYTLGRAIGAGTFGTVHLATDNATGQEVAVKVITKRVIGGYLEGNFVRRVQHEVDIYNHLGRSLNVAYLYGAWETPVHVQLVMELCTGGELWTRVQRGKYDEAAAAALCREILCTVAQCHAKGIVLRDVKPENFLFKTAAADAPLKMIDFGLATYCKPGQLLSDRAGSPLYVAPEVLKQSYGQPCDVWSAGVVAYQLLTGRFPFEDEDCGLLLSSLDVLGKKHFTNKEIFFAILYGELDFHRPPWDEISDLARAFVAHLLERDPAKRPSAEEALQHPWLRQFDATASAASAASSMASVDGGNGAAASAAPGNGTAASRSGGGAGGSGRPLSDSLVQRLQRFGTYGRLKQLALRAVVSFMATAETERIASLAAAFRSLDPAGRGVVPYDAVGALLNNGDWDLSRTEVSQLLATFDIDLEGNVDYNEWLAALIDWREVQESAGWQKYVNQVFDMFDQEHTGRLTPENIQRVLCGGGLLAGASSGSSGSEGDMVADPEGADAELDECPFDDVVPAAMREADEDHDGAISREEFVRFLSTAPGDKLEFYESRRKRLGAGGSGSDGIGGGSGAAL